MQEMMSILWLNKQHRFIIPYTHAKPKSILTVGLLCIRYRDTIDCLYQKMKITTSTQTHMMESSIKKRGYKGGSR